MNPTKQSIKSRFSSYIADHEGLTVKAVAEAADVSERTMRRHLNPDDPSIGDVVMLYKAARAFDISLDLLFFPDEFPKTRARRSQLNNFRHSVQTNIAFLWTDEDMNVGHCTDSFAALYGSTPREMIGTNMFQDWSFYAEDNYRWLSRPVPDTRKSQIETLVAEARENGSGSLQTFFLSPDGTLTEVLMKCYYLDPGFLFLDVPKEYNAITAGGLATIDEQGQPVLRFPSVDIYFDDLEVLSGFMSGWDRQKIADRVGLSRTEVTQALERAMKWMGVEDLDALRETVWERIFAPTATDKYNIIRCNGKALK